MRDNLEATYESLLFMDGFDGAILGVSDNFREPVVVYSRVKCIEILILEHEMDYMEAVEYFDFNVAGAYVGEQTPIIVNDDFEDF
jgi:hypothetical protein